MRRHSLRKMRSNLGGGKPIAALFLLSTLLLSGCQTLSVNRTRMSQPYFTPAATSHAWASPIQKVGLPNLFQVSPNLYRGAQPTAEGFLQLKAMGIKTVINLCQFGDDREKIARAGLASEDIPMNAWHADKDDVERFLSVITDKSRGPFFVHCQHGADRTGMMCALYRVNVQGWTKDEAVAEMTQGGFGFHGIFSNLAGYVRKSPLKKDAMIADVKLAD